MSVDAIILSGGRGSRLGGADKGALRIDGETLLDRTVAAVSHCRHVVVVGPVGDAAGRALVVREDPPFAGPAAGVVAALRVLPASAPADRILVLACDLRHPASVIAALLGAEPEALPEPEPLAEPEPLPGPEALPEPEALPGRGTARSLLLRDGGRLQYLAGVHDAFALRDAARTLPAAGADASMRALLAPLDPVAVDVPDGTTADVDTPAEAVLAGIRLSRPTDPENR